MNRHSFILIVYPANHYELYICPGYTDITLKCLGHTDYMNILLTIRDQSLPWKIVWYIFNNSATALMWWQMINAIKGVQNIILNNKPHTNSRLMDKYFPYTWNAHNFPFYCGILGFPIWSNRMRMAAKRVMLWHRLEWIINLTATPTSHEGNSKSLVTQLFV